MIQVYLHLYGEWGSVKGTILTNSWH